MKTLSSDALLLLIANMTDRVGKELDKAVRKTDDAEQRIEILASLAYAAVRIAVDCASKERPMPRYQAIIAVLNGCKDFAEAEEPKWQ